MRRRLKLKLWDEDGRPIASTKGEPKELGKKLKGWLEKMR